LLSCSLASSVEAVRAWFATFFAVVLSGASILLAVWGIWLIADPPEEIHFEYAIPALVLAGVGLSTAAVLWLRGRE
jgi:hypothetical protein